MVARLSSSPGLRWSGCRLHAWSSPGSSLAGRVTAVDASGESDRGERGGARRSGHKGKARQAGRRGACIELENFLTFSQSMHGQHKADMRRFNLSASAALKNDFRPLKYSSQVRLSRYIHLRSAICIVKQETYQHPSKMNTNGPKIAFGPQL